MWLLYWASSDSHGLTALLLVMCSQLQGVARCVSVLCCNEPCHTFLQIRGQLQALWLLHVALMVWHCFVACLWTMFGPSLGSAIWIGICSVIATCKSQTGGESLSSVTLTERHRLKGCHPILQRFFDYVDFLHGKNVQKHTFFWRETYMFGQRKSGCTWNHVKHTWFARKTYMFGRVGNMYVCARRPLFCWVFWPA